MNATIRQKFLGFSGAIVVLDLLLVGLILAMLQNTGTITRAELVAQQSLALALELQLSSDELTRLARTYVVTGDPSYEQAYWQVLDVRNGAAPRADGRQVPLRTLMQEIGFTTEEFAKLTEAENNSNNLVGTETAAFQALLGRYMPVPGTRSTVAADYTRVAEPDPALAVRIMHDAQYHADKAVIMAPIAEARAMVEARTQAAVAAALNRGRLLIGFAIVVGVALIALLAAAYLLAQRPVLAATETLRGHLEGLAAGTIALSERMPVQREDEIGGVGRAFNHLMERLLGLVDRVRDSGLTVSASTAQLAASARQLEATLNEQLASTNDVMSSTQQISATSESLADTMADVKGASRGVVDLAAEGHSGMEVMRETMEKIEQGAARLSQQLSTINQKVGNITQVVTTITQVADQTNLLSINAGIEASKAGEFGRGFTIVAREIRRLADQTAAATLDIETMVREMHSAVSSGVMGMDAFGRDLQRSAGEVKRVSEQMEQIIDEVQSIGPRIEAVSEGTQSQSLGARHIAESMSQLSEAGRTSADMQQQAARAIEQLDQAARHLAEEVERFRGAAED